VLEQNSRTDAKLALLHEENKLEINIIQDTKIKTRKMKTGTELEDIDVHPETAILEK
jgi:hypothetical protein